MLKREISGWFVCMVCAAGTVRADGDGWLGQSQSPDGPPIAWCECAWVQDDAAGNVYLPDGWKVPAGMTRAVKMKTTVPGRLYSDGVTLYAWQPRRGMIRRVKTTADGGLADDGLWCRLPDWRYSFFFVPTVQTNGYAGRFRALLLHRETKTVYGLDAEGTCSPPLHVCGAAERAAVRSVALHPVTGDLLVGSTWPEMLIRRYRTDGTPVRNAKWPYRCRADEMKSAGGRLWALGGNARTIDEAGETTGGRTIGENANVTRDVARGAAGVWLATTQGAQYYPAADPTGRCAVRLGGLPGVSGVAVLNGRVLAVAGGRLFALWLDDRPDEPLHSDERWLVRPNRYDGRGTAVEARDGLFFIRDEGSRKTWAFNPEQTQWLLRHKRQYETNVTVRADTPLEARADGWAVRYDPVRKGLYRFRP
jgi:hypothetical protein